MNRPAFPTSDYHNRELAQQLDHRNPGRLLPPIYPSYETVLDIGCGIGQTLIALSLPLAVEVIGVDVDRDAINRGILSDLPKNIYLEHAAGELLPFENGKFDFVFSRVSIPYMDIGKAMPEIARVLKPGGEIWFALHPASMYLARAWKALKTGKFKELANCAYILANGLLFNLLGIQVSIRGRQETFQTFAGIRRAMNRAGLECWQLPAAVGFLVMGKKADQ